MYVRERTKCAHTDQHRTSPFKLLIIVVVVCISIGMENNCLMSSRALKKISTIDDDKGSLIWITRQKSTSRKKIVEETREKNSWRKKKNNDDQSDCRASLSRMFSIWAHGWSCRCNVLVHLLYKLDNIFHVIFWHYNLSMRILQLFFCLPRHIQVNWCCWTEFNTHELDID